MLRWFNQRLNLSTALVIFVGLVLVLKYASAYFFETPVSWRVLEVSLILAGCAGIAIGHLVRASKA